MSIALELASGRPRARAVAEPGIVVTRIGTVSVSVRRRVTVASVPMPVSGSGRDGWREYRQETVRLDRAALGRGALDPVALAPQVRDLGLLVDRSESDE